MILEEETCTGELIEDLLDLTADLSEKNHDAALLISKPEELKADRETMKNI
jgi:hypothetical protein